ncbi:unnamed protein product [Mytilus edulis]|uniref:Uncharacterized protein n=1 Tax=Mytilus edulis TaxID=6550 RepID=A0A8S3RLX7_MYTED|nr:unnamed protein product [Mytilus edulis]
MLNVDFPLIILFLYFVIRQQPVAVGNGVKTVILGQKGCVGLNGANGVLNTSIVTSPGQTVHQLLSPQRKRQLENNSINDSSTSTSDLFKQIEKCTSTSTNLTTTFCRDKYISPASVDPTMDSCYNEVTRTHAPPPAIFSSDILVSNAETYLTIEQLDNSSNALFKLMVPS